MNSTNQVKVSHTAGPWRAYQAEFGWSVRSEPTGERIVHEQLEADARLIAAAPELLEALESMWRFVDDTPDRCPMCGGGGVHRKNSVCLVVKATIQKARGEA